MAAVDRAARRLDLRTVRAGMVICSVLAVACAWSAAFEFRALHVRWDTNAYGSAAWATLVTHSTLLLLETVETAGVHSPALQPEHGAAGPVRGGGQCRSTGIS